MFLVPKCIWFEPPWCAAMGQAAGGAPWVMCGAPAPQPPISSFALLHCGNPPSPPVCFAVSPLHTMFLLPPSLSAGHLHHRGSACKLSTRILIIFSKIPLPIYHSMKLSHVQWPMWGVTGARMWHFFCHMCSSMTSALQGVSLLQIIQPHLDQTSCHTWP